MPPFENRISAARELARRLKAYRGRHPLVLAIPRGAVPMAAEIARSVEGDLDVVLAHKIPLPGNPEFALGAITERGHVYINPALSGLRLPPGYLQAEMRHQTENLRERRAMYSKAHESRNPEGRIVIVVDDGAATGATTIAALREVRSRSPDELVVAMAVAPPEVVAELEREADRVVVLLVPPAMGSVGEFFDDFRQVSDDEVIRILAEFRPGSVAPSESERRGSCGSGTS